MKSNLGTVDRIVRIAAGLGIGVAGIVFRNWLGLIGLVPLVTGLIGFCPLYLPFGLSTKRKK